MAFPASDTDTDAVLVARFKGGDESAFVEIVNRYRQKIVTLNQSFGNNHADAEDLAQDVFVRAYRGLKNFRGDSALSTWLYRIAANLSRNHYWHYFRRRKQDWVSVDRPLNDSTSDTFAEVIMTEGDIPICEVAIDEFVGLIEKGMSRLDRDHREILVLRNTKHFTYEEIACILGITVGTVKSRIARAREKLRSFMVHACPELKGGKDLLDLLKRERFHQGMTVRA